MGNINIYTKWSSLSKSVKASMAFAFSSILIKGISFFTTPIFTRILSETQYGIIADYNSWLQIIEIFALLGLTSAGVFNVGLNDYSEKRDYFVSTVLVLSNIATLICFGIIFGIRYFLGIYILDFKFLVLMEIHFLFFPAQIFWITRKRYEYEYKLPILITLLSVALEQGLSIICVMNATEEQGYIRLVSYEVGAMIVNLPIYYSILKKGKKFIDIDIWKYTLRFAIPLLPHYLAQHVMGSSDKIMLTSMVSNAATGIYSVVSNLSLLSTIVWNAINGSFIPYSFEKLNEKKYSDIRKVSNALVAGFGVVCLVVVLIAPEVLSILAPKSYAVGLTAIPPIAVVAFLSAVYSVFANIEFYYKKSKYITGATIIAAVSNLLLNYWLIPKYSFTGAAYATMISYIILSGIHYLGYKSTTAEKIYDSRFIMSFVIFFMLLCLGVGKIYSLVVVRYLLLAAFAVVVWIKRNAIINIYRGMSKKQDE